jgi:hypothetical protein
MRRTFLLLAWLLVPTAAMAQVRSETGGLRLSAHLVGSSISFRDADLRESGLGVGISGGYGFTPRFQLLGRFDAAVIRADEGLDYALVHADLTIRYNFANSDRRLVPFVSAGVSERSVIREDSTGAGESVVSGASITLGGGLSYFFSPSFALEGELSVGLQRPFYKERPACSGWYACDTLFEDDPVIFSASTTRLAAGVSWYPRGRRAVVASAR